MYLPSQVSTVAPFFRRYPVSHTNDPSTARESVAELQVMTFAGLLAWSMAVHLVQGLNALPFHTGLP